MGGMANVLGDKRVGRPRRDVLPWVYLMVFLVGIVAVVGFTWYHIANERQVALEHWHARLSTLADDRARLAARRRGCAGGLGRRSRGTVRRGRPRGGRAARARGGGLRLSRHRRRQ